MILTLLVLATNAWATCPEPTLSFSGQPDCVQLTTEEDRITLTNTCEQPLLIDQSVQVHETGSTPTGLIGVQSTTHIRGMGFFTVGLEGQLYQVVAKKEAVACEEEDTAAAKTTPPAPVATGFFH